ncbi:hypothetical protein WN55_02803 [Dufourea novaeangliae]|uniref:Uncharacterized protein n=1 Tax=Dufourea novaeangliae TaxID=178035 RepID=A0A154NZZ1_DUFNO|nr:hypothetical protein WN55_02803 [Dufourea novaeangliae]
MKIESTLNETSLSKREKANKKLLPFLSPASYLSLLLRFDQPFLCYGVSSFIREQGWL